MSGLYKYKKSQLIEFIKLYNLATHISGYYKMKKRDLIKAIYSKFTINNKGEIEVLPDLKINTKKTSKEIKKKRKENKKKQQEYNQMIKLVRRMGGLRGQIEKYKDELKDMDEEIEYDYRLKKDKSFQNKYNEKIEEINKLKKELSEVFKEIKKLREIEEKAENNE